MDTSNSRLTKITVYHLEMTAPEQMRLPARPLPDVQIDQARIPCPELNRFLYASVGGDWYWRERLGWTYDRWESYLDRETLETWVAYWSGTPAGYFELERQPGGSVEIAYFGLLRRFIGRGLGGQLLGEALTRSWEMIGTNRVWVHTCSLDHPGALANYQARGMRLFKIEEVVINLPTEPPGPWPGANRVAENLIP